MIEVDILLKKWKNHELKNKICIESNGPWHYPRNSEESFGKDIMKDKILKSEGY